MFKGEKVDDSWDNHNPFPTQLSQFFSILAVCIPYWSDEISKTIYSLVLEFIGLHGQFANLEEGANVDEVRMEFVFFQRFTCGFI